MKALKTGYLTLGSIPAAPQFATASLPAATVGQSWSAALQASGAEPLTWSLQDGALPDGVTLGAAGALACVPSVLGSFTFTLRVSNPVGFATRQFTVAVTPVPVAPAIDTASLPDAVKGVAYSASLQASGTTPIAWTVAAGTLPAGLTLSGAGAISGTPGAEGASTFTVQAANAGGTVTRQLTLTVNVLPAIATTSLPAATQGVPYTATLAATGTAPIAWAVSAGALPEGLALSAAGVLAGTPSESGAFAFTARASNVAGATTRQLAMTVVVAPAITTATLPDATRFVAYSRLLSASGTAPVTWSLAAGAPPAGLTLTTTGAISGTPTAIETAAFTVRATNVAGTATRPLTMQVFPPVAPTIVTAALPDASDQAAYSATLVATGTPPFTWSRTAGALPSGLTLAAGGSIAGTPSGTGTASFTVQVSNVIGFVSRPLTLTVRPSAPIITTASLPDGVDQAA